MTEHSKEILIINDKKAETEYMMNTLKKDNYFKNFEIKPFESHDAALAYMGSDAEAKTFLKLPAAILYGVISDDNTSVVGSEKLVASLKGKNVGIVITSTHLDDEDLVRKKYDNQDIKLFHSSEEISKLPILVKGVIEQATLNKAGLNKKQEGGGGLPGELYHGFSR